MIGFGTQHIGNGVVAKYNAKLTEKQRMILAKYCSIHQPHITVCEIGKGLTRIEGFCAQGTWWNLRCKLDECMAISKATVLLAKAREARSYMGSSSIYDDESGLIDNPALDAERANDVSNYEREYNSDCYSASEVDELPF